jgi:amidase
VLSPSELPVAGPLARSAEDLLLELDVVAGPEPEEAVAYRWSLPRPRKTKLSEYKIGFLIDDPFCPVDSTMKEVLSGAIESLRKGGAQLTEGWPKGVNPQAMYDNYMFLLSAILNAALPEAAIKGMLAAAESGVKDPWILGATTRHLDWSRQTEQRFRARAAWREHFKNFDAFLAPVNFVPAFPHDHKPDLLSRKLATADGERNYIDQSKWISFATLSGCPATVAPAGRTKSGLPVGIQVIGPYLEDATPIDIALKLSQLIGGFTSPPGYNDV